MLPWARRPRRRRPVGSVLVGGVLVDGLLACLVVHDLEVLQVEVGLVYLEILAGLGFEVVIALYLVFEVFVYGARFGRGGLLRAAAGGRRAGE